MALADHLLDLRSHGQDHVPVGNDVSPVDDGAVAWYELGVWTGKFHGGVERFQSTLQRAAVVGVDEGIPVVPIEVADHDHVYLLKPDHRITAGMGCPNRNQVDHFA